MGLLDSLVNEFTHSEGQGQGQRGNGIPPPPQVPFPWRAMWVSQSKSLSAIHTVKNQDKKNIVLIKLSLTGRPSRPLPLHQRANRRTHF